MKNYLQVFFLLSVLGLLVYYNSLNNKFLIDDYYFLSRPALSGMKFILSQWNPYQQQALGVLDNQERLGYYRPMAHMVLDLSYAVFKNNYWQYHLLNLFLFVFASSLVYLLVKRLTDNDLLAFLAGALYLVHPINGIVVNYISASVFAFQVIFMLATILLLWGSLEGGSNRPLYLLSLLFSFLSLFWNESGVMTPFYLCAAVLLFRQDPLKKKVFYLLPYFLIVFSYLVLRLNFLGVNEPILAKMKLYHMTAGEYAATLLQIAAWYTGKLFYPQGVVMAWVTPVLRDHLAFYVWGVFLLLMLLLSFFVRFFKSKICLMAMVWMLIGFAPVCLAAFRMPDVGILIEPHWFIFSSIGFFILAAYFCSFILRRAKTAGMILLFAIIFSWGAVSHADNRLWADQKTYCLYWLKQVPDLKSARFYLAYAYKQEGDLNEAEKYYRQSWGWSDKEIYNNLGLIDKAEGHYKEAESNYKMALKLDPYWGIVYGNLGSLYYEEGRWEKARENFAWSLRLNPLLIEPRLGLAEILLKDAQYQKAIDLCLQNLDIVSDDPKTLLLLMDISLRQKDFIDLEKYAQRFLSSETDPEVLTKDGVRLALENAPDLAMACFTKAIRLAPDYKEAYLAAGTLFADFGKFNEAIHIWKAGSTIDPSDQRFKNDITKAMVLKAPSSF